jgi:hypothetical protein
MGWPLHVSSSNRFFTDMILHQTGNGIRQWFWTMVITLGLLMLTPTISVGQTIDVASLLDQLTTNDTTDAVHQAVDQLLHTNQSHTPSESDRIVSFNIKPNVTFLESLGLEVFSALDLYYSAGLISNQTLSLLEEMGWIESVEDNHPIQLANQPLVLHLEEEPPSMHNIIEQPAAVENWVSNV